MRGETIRIRKALGTLRATDAGPWQVQLEFEIELPWAVERWNNGTDWTSLGAEPGVPGFNGLQLAAESALSDIEADIERCGYLPFRTFSDVEWDGEDDASRDLLRKIVDRQDGLQDHN
jgi:hypothetical protein